MIPAPVSRRKPREGFGAPHQFACRGHQHWRNPEECAQGRIHQAAFKHLNIAVFGNFSEEIPRSIRSFPQESSRMPIPWQGVSCYVVASARNTANGGIK